MPGAFGYKAYGPGKTPESVLAELNALPEVEAMTKLSDVEGWSAVVHRAGVRLSDFLTDPLPLATRSGHPAGHNLADPLNLPADFVPCVGMLMPDEQCYVGRSTASAPHPQMLPCYRDVPGYDRDAGYQGKGYEGERI